MYIGNSPATGDNNSFKILDNISSYTLTFNGSSGSVVSVTNDTITQNNHRFLTGQRVTYTAAGTAIGGLTSGNVYFIIKTDYSTFKLATSYSDAVNSIAIDFTALGTGTHSINVAFDGFNTRFKTTYDNGTRTQISRAAQLQISINGVIQQPNDTSTPTNGFGIDLDSVVVFSAAPSASDIFWGNVLANNFPTFDISDNTIDSFTGTGSQVSFALSKTPANSQNVLVTINGVVQYPTDGSTVRSYSVDGNVLIFTAAPAAASVIQVRHIGFAGPTSSNVTGFYGRTGNVGLTTADAINVGSATIGVGAAGTSLLVQGNARITGILTIGTGSITFDGNANTITGISTISAPSISGVATFSTGPVLIGAATSTGTAAQRLQVTGGAYVSGNLGIGTTNPASTVAASIKATTSNFAIDILGRDADNSSQIRFVNNTQSAVLGSLRHDGTNLIIGNTLNSPLIFNTNNTEVARITGVGFVGIATNNPQSTLAIGGTVTELYNGQFWNLVSQADIGIGASQISVNGMLGDMAFQNSASINVANASVTSLNGGQLGGSRNMIINGSMVVNQRGWTGAAGTTTNNAYVTDRFLLFHSHDGAVSAGQTSMNSTVGGNAFADGFRNALYFTVTTADTSIAASQYQNIIQKIEGFNVQGIKKGTVNAQPVTLSFWVRSNLTGTYIAELWDNDNTRACGQAYTINTADTWEKKTLIFPADTTGVFDNDQFNSLHVQWFLAAGSDYSGGAALQTTWGGAGNTRAVGQVNLLGTAGNNFFLTGVQLEVGDRATEFERRSYGQELQLCQRYYYRIQPTNQYSAFCNGWNDGTTTSRGVIHFPITMRTRPTTLEQTGIASDYYLNATSGGGVCTGVPTFDTSTQNQSSVNWTKTGLTAGQATLFQTNVANAYLAWSAEL